MSNLSTCIALNILIFQDPKEELMKFWGLGGFSILKIQTLPQYSQNQHDQVCQSMNLLSCTNFSVSLLWYCCHQERYKHSLLHSLHSPQGLLAPYSGLLILLPTRDQILYSPYYNIWHPLLISVLVRWATRVYFHKKTVKIFHILCQGVINWGCLVAVGSVGPVISYRLTSGLY